MSETQQQSPLDANGVEAVLAYIDEHGANADVKFELTNWISAKLKANSTGENAINAVIYDNPAKDLIKIMTNGEITVSKVLTLVIHPDTPEYQTLSKEERREHMVQFNVVMGIEDGLIAKLFDMEDA
jgi:hypothetical protein